MDYLSLINGQQSYFDVNTSSDIKKKFINKMYINLLPNLSIIGLSMTTMWNEYTELFLDSSTASGLFVIMFYVLFISTAFLYCNYDDLSSYYDYKPYSYIFTMCFSYLLTYFSNLLKTSFLIYCIIYLIVFNLTTILYTYQNTINFNYTTLIKISFTCEFLIFIFLTAFNDIEYILSTYLFSSIATLYILCDTENMISSNNRTFNVKVDHSSLAAVLLYLDIFTLFPFIINTFIGR